MEDTANGRYKIGMSKKPEYRERTLQSEKPEITLICSKMYSSRDEARKIEKELHQRFKNNRIRGEWFNLSYLDGGILSIVSLSCSTAMEVSLPFNSTKYWSP